MTGWVGHNIAPGRYLSSSPIHYGKKAVMSQAVWCDIDDPETNAYGQIGHSFSDKDPDKRHYAQTASVDVPTGNSYGQTTYQTRQEVTDELDMCGYHWRKTNPFLAKNKPVIPAPPTLQDLEQEDDAYRAGYQAAMDSVLAGEPE